MATSKYTCPPQSATGSGTFSDDLVGFQLVTGGGLTQGNFGFTETITEKTNRTFSIGAFSGPINLESMAVESIEQSKRIFENNYKVYPNFDVSQVTNFTLYGSLVKRISTSVTNIINYFPAALEIKQLSPDYSTGATATNISYSITDNETYFEVNIARIRNPFAIDYSVNATRNLSLREMPVSELRNLTTQYKSYSLFINNNQYDVIFFTPSAELEIGTLKFYVIGDAFSGQSVYYGDLVIRPNDYYVNKTFNEQFDEVENFLLNRLVTPIYTATFQVPESADDGTYFINKKQITWPLNGLWNLDISTNNFTNYLTTLTNITTEFDDYKTNLISRFLVTGAIKDYDTQDQKVEKVLQLYGRSFDETKKFIDALAYMNSVNYNVGNDIPSQLLKNLSETLGWRVNISPISNDELLNSVFNVNNGGDNPQFEGYSRALTPDELNYQYYRNLILNSAYLFKSKGTRKSIEILMRMIGAPDALVEFNEYVYLADQRININQFNESYAKISGGTYVTNTPILDANNTFSIKGVQYSGYTTTSTIQDVNIDKSEYPIDENGYPAMITPSDDYFFQVGSGWFESTPQHRSPEIIESNSNLFTGFNPDYQTKLAPYTYGQEYLNLYRSFPYMNLGYNLRQTIDNKKSWTDDETGLRDNQTGNFDARYYTPNDNLVINVKNVDLFLNPAQGLVYDVWYMSTKYDFPIPETGLKVPYPQRGGVDNTYINPEPKRKTFFEFAQTFWHNMINVRNRQYITAYPTLSSIYWKYLESETYGCIQNDNFTYTTMIDYIDKIGEYWIRLVEQMIPATTIWNTGFKYENSIFHRQKFVWRRQMGCTLKPVPCDPCNLTGPLFPNGCVVNSVKCSLYPWQVDPTLNSFSAVLGNLLTNYLTSIGYTVGQCDLNTLQTEWFVDIRINGDVYVLNSFYNGYGLNFAGLSYPTASEWLTALETGLDEMLGEYALDYYITSDDNVVIFTEDCSINKAGNEIQINVGINFNLYCV